MTSIGAIRIIGADYDMPPEDADRDTDFVILAVDRHYYCATHCDGGWSILYEDSYQEWSYVGCADTLYLVLDAIIEDAEKRT